MAWTAKQPSIEWATPAWLFDELSALFGPFDLDPASTDDNAKTIAHYTAEDDGLARRWRGRVFLNPPYGKATGDWMLKARREADLGATVVCLVPARLDTAWWHEACTRSTVLFRRGRVNFVGGKVAGPFPVAVVVMRPDDPPREPTPVGSWWVVA